MMKTRPFTPPACRPALRRSLLLGAARAPKQCAGECQDRLHRPAERRRRALRQERGQRHGDGHQGDQCRAWRWPARRSSWSWWRSTTSTPQPKPRSTRAPGAAAQDAGRVRAALGRHLSRCRPSTSRRSSCAGVLQHAAGHRARQQAHHPHPAHLHHSYIEPFIKLRDEEVRQEGRHAAGRPRLREGLERAVRSRHGPRPAASGVEQPHVVQQAPPTSTAA
jgi:hypothetical protein